MLPDGSTAGNTPYWNGTNWVVNSSNIFNNGGSVGIGTSTPNTSAALEIQSDSKALLISRLDDEQRNEMTPVEGMIIYNSDDRTFQGYQGLTGAGEIDQSAEQHPGGWYFGLDYNQSVGQSFTASATGRLSKVTAKVGYFNNGYEDPSENATECGGDISLTLEVFAGNGTSGTVLETKNFVATGADYGDLTFHEYQLNNVMVQEGQQYTIQIRQTEDCSGNLVWGSNEDVYPSGNAYANGNQQGDDVAFQTYLATTEPGWVQLNSTAVSSNGGSGSNGGLSEGASTSATAYWNGSAWVNDNNITNNGGVVAVGTNNTDNSNGTIKMRIANGLLSLGEVNEASDFTINNTCGDVIAEHVTSGIIAQEPGPGGCGDDWYMISMNRDGSEARTLEIGIANDGDDHINLQSTGNVGINERNPQARLHVNGNVRINDGTEGDGKVLTSDGSGNASWQNPGAGSLVQIIENNGSFMDVQVDMKYMITKGPDVDNWAYSNINLPSAEGNSGKVIEIFVAMSNDELRLYSPSGIKGMDENIFYPNVGEFATAYSSGMDRNSRIYIISDGNIWHVIGRSVWM